jgi:hypothetical protein
MAYKELHINCAVLPRGGRVCRNRIARAIIFGNKLFTPLLPKEAQKRDRVGSSGKSVAKLSRNCGPAPEIRR